MFLRKNLGRLWLAYTELQGDFYMLQFISVDSRHFTQTYLSLGWSDLHEIKSVITPLIHGKNHGHLWVEYDLHSFFPAWSSKLRQTLKETLNACHNMEDRCLQPTPPPQKRRSILSCAREAGSLFGMIWCTKRMTVHLFGWCNTNRIWTQRYGCVRYDCVLIPGWYPTRVYDCKMDPTRT